LRSVGLVARLLFAVHADGIDGQAVDHVARVMGLQVAGTSAARWCKLARLLIGSIHPTGEAGRVAGQA
jgi:hypothetical protein